MKVGSHNLKTSKTGNDFTVTNRAKEKTKRNSVPVWKTVKTIVPTLIITNVSIVALTVASAPVGVLVVAGFLGTILTVISVVFLIKSVLASKEILPDKKLEKVNSGESRVLGPKIIKAWKNYFFEKSWELNLDHLLDFLFVENKEGEPRFPNAGFLKEFGNLVIEILSIAYPELLNKKVVKDDWEKHALEWIYRLRDSIKGPSSDNTDPLVCFPPFFNYVKLDNIPLIQGIIFSSIKSSDFPVEKKGKKEKIKLNSSILYKKLGHSRWLIFWKLGGWTLNRFGGRMEGMLDLDVPSRESDFFKIEDTNKKTISVEPQLDKIFEDFWSRFGENFSKIKEEDLKDFDKSLEALGEFLKEFLPAPNCGNLPPIKEPENKLLLEGAFDAFSSPRDAHDFVKKYTTDAESLKDTGKDAESLKDSLKEIYSKLKLESTPQIKQQPKP